MNVDTDLSYSNMDQGNRWPLERNLRIYKGRKSDSVVILAADSNYVEHAKATFVNCRLQGQWRKDFALILAKGTNPEPFRDRGIYIFPSDIEDGFYQKLDIFSSVFRRWEYACYMDCDVLVQDSLQTIFDELETHTLLGHKEPFDLFHMFTYWATMETYNKAPPGVYNWLWSNFDPRYIQFNTACLPFRPHSVPDDAVNRLLAMKEKIDQINIHVIRGTDQPVINLTFYRQFAEIRDRLFCHWNEESPESVLLHYCSGYAPWIKKTPGMEAYNNPRLKRPCYDIYQENLARWEEVFPLC